MARRSTGEQSQEGLREEENDLRRRHRKRRRTLPRPDVWTVCSEWTAGREQPQRGSADLQGLPHGAQPSLEVGLAQTSGRVQSPTSSRRGPRVGHWRKGGWASKTGTHSPHAQTQKESRRRRSASGEGQGRTSGATRSVQGLGRGQGESLVPKECTETTQPNRQRRGMPRLAKRATRHKTRQGRLQGRREGTAHGEGDSARRHSSLTDRSHPDSKTKHAKFGGSKKESTNLDTRDKSSSVGNQDAAVKIPEV